MNFPFPHLSVFFLSLLCTTFSESAEIQTFDYGEHPRHKLDVLAPDDARNAPVVVFIHGGGWMTGDKDIYHYVQRRLAREKVVTVSANYRLSPEAAFPDFVTDAADVVAWTVRNITTHGGDPRRIYLMGHSAGAHSVAMLGLNESYLRNAGIDQKVIKGVIPISAPLLLKVSQVPKLAFVFGKASDHEMWPLSFVDGDEPPFLLLHGEKDPLVQSIHSRVAERMIREAGGKVTARYYENHDHISIVGAFSPRYEKRGNVVEPIMQMIRGD